MKKMVLFQTGNVKFAIELTAIRHLGPKTNAPAAAQGRIQQQTIQYEGRPLKLIDLAAALDQNAGAPLPKEGKMIVVKRAPAKALWADNVQGIFTADEEQMYDLPSVFTGTARTCFPKVLRYKEHLILVTDTDALDNLEQHSGASMTSLPTSERVG